MQESLFSSEVPKQREVSSILAERRNQHGAFAENARLTELFVAAAKTSQNWKRLPPSLRQALVMGWHKDARIMSGDFLLLDHWNDKAGYAELGARAAAGLK